MAVLWAITLLITLAAGAACAAMSEWRLRVSSPVATATNSVAYSYHGRTYFAPPVAANWYDRATSIFPVLLGCFVAISLIALVFAWQSDAMGRRWRGR